MQPLIIGGRVASQNTQLDNIIISYRIVSLMAEQLSRIIQAIACGYNIH